MLVTSSGRLILTRLVQSWKAKFPMVVTPSESVIPVRPVQPDKALVPMTVTGLPVIDPGRQSRDVQSMAFLRTPGME